MANSHQESVVCSVLEPCHKVYHAILTDLTIKMRDKRILSAPRFLFGPLPYKIYVLFRFPRVVSPLCLDPICFILPAFLGFGIPFAVRGPSDLYLVSNL